MSHSRPRATQEGLFAATLLLALSACGVGGLGQTAAGQAQTDALLAGSITLNDSSLPTQTRQAPMGDDGAYAVQVTGLVPPFLLRVGWTDASGARQLYGIADDAGNVDVNGITDVAYWSACAGEPEERLFADSSADRKRDASVKARAHVATLVAALAPLLERYGIADPSADRDAVRVLLQDVSVVRLDGLLLVTNRVTGGVVFQGPAEDLASGTFVAASMPPGPGIPTCTSFTYSAYGACRPDGTQVRTVLASLPAGCASGAPVTVQACTYLPPSPACTSFTYSAYGACRPDGTQVRTVLTSIPRGCSGGAPLTSRACVYVPPIDGAALYTQYCAGCHGNSRKGSRASTIQRAIDRNTGRMGTAALRALTPAQIAAISAAP